MYVHIFVYKYVFLQNMMILQSLHTSTDEELSFNLFTLETLAYYPPIACLLWHFGLHYFAIPKEQN